MTAITAAARARMKKLTDEAESRLRAAAVERVGAVGLPLPLKTGEQGELFQPWQEPLRGLCNHFARAALFTASHWKQPRERMGPTPLFTAEGFELVFSGEELRQDDLDVWLQVVHFGRMTDVGQEFTVIPHTMLVALGWGRSKKDYNRLRECVLRLKGAEVRIKDERIAPGRQLVTNLITELRWDAEGKDDRAVWGLQLSKALVTLYLPTNYSLVEWEQRLALSPLAKWIHAFYSTHREPFPYSVAKLHAMCGSKNKRVASFRLCLVEALNELKQQKFLDGWEILKSRTEKAGVLNVSRTRTTKVAP